MLRRNLLHVAKHEQGQLGEVEAGADHIHLLAAEFIMLIMVKLNNDNGFMIIVMIILMMEQ